MTLINEIDTVFKSWLLERLRKGLYDTIETENTDPLAKRVDNILKEALTDAEIGLTALLTVSDKPTAETFKELLKYGDGDNLADVLLSGEWGDIIIAIGTKRTRDIEQKIYKKLPFENLLQTIDAKTIHAILEAAYK